MMASFHDLSGANSAMSRSMASPVDVPMAISPPRSPMIAPLTPKSMSASPARSGSLPSPLLSLPPAAAALLTPVERSTSTRIGHMEVPVVYHRHSITDFDSHLLPPAPIWSPANTVTHSGSNPASPIDDEPLLDSDYSEDNSNNNNNNGRQSSSCCRRLAGHHGSPVLVTFMVLMSAVVTWDMTWLAGVRP
jgi:hypothetical protein